VDRKAFLLAQAARLRRLAHDVLDEKAEEALLGLAAEYDEQAAALAQSEHANCSEAIEGEGQ